MNRKNNTDRLFASLKETSEVAPMHLWPSIEAAITDERKKKRHFLWFGLFGFLLLAGSSLMIYAQSSNSTEKQITELPTAKKSTNNTRTQPKLKEQKTSLKAVQTAKTEGAQQSTTQEVTFQKSAVATHTNSPKKALLPIVKKQKKNITPKDQKLHQFPASLQENLRKQKRKGAITPPILKEIASLPQTEINLPKLDFAQAPPEEECAGSRVIKVPKSIFIDAYVSPVFSNTFFASKTSEASSYARLRDSTERNGIGLLVGARIGYIHESGVNLRAGIAYQQIRNKFQYNVEQDEKMIIQIFRDDLGNIIGRDTTYEFGRRRLNVANKYTTVDIPVSVGYISMKNKVQIGFHVGAVLNLNFNQTGTYLDQESLVKHFSDKNIFENSVGTSFFSSVELQYLLLDHWGIFIEPQVRFYPKSLTTKSHPIKQNLTNFNVLTGIKYIF